MQDPDQWPFIRDQDEYNQAAEFAFARNYWDSYHKMGEFTIEFDEFDCESELVCEWVDCLDFELHEDIYGENQECWREECYDDCGDYLCVVWHWNEDDYEWIQDECEEEPEMFDVDWENIDWEDVDAANEDATYAAESFADDFAMEME